MELGPCRVTNATGEPKYFEESWNSNANIFFIDQPIGVGFSYAEYGETVSTTEEAAVDVARFVAVFFENFSKFKGRAFHMAGESYGVRAHRATVYLRADFCNGPGSLHSTVCCSRLRPERSFDQ